MDRFVVRYWPDGRGSRSREQVFATLRDALKFANLETNLADYMIYECKVIATNF